MYIYTNDIYSLSNTQHNLITQLQHKIDANLLKMRDKIHFISNRVLDNLFITTKIQ
jgi:hypothetical protein